MSAELSFVLSQFARVWRTDGRTGGGRWKRENGKGETRKRGNVFFMVWVFCRCVPLYVHSGLQKSASGRRYETILRADALCMTTFCSLSLDTWTEDSQADIVQDLTVA